MRISDWSSDVCSSYLPSQRRARPHPCADPRRSDGADLLHPLSRCEPARLCPGPGGADAVVGDELRRFRVATSRTDDRDVRGRRLRRAARHCRSEEHTSELQSLMRISYAVFCLKKKKRTRVQQTKQTTT